MLINKKIKIFLLIILISLQSCGAFKSVFKSSNKSKDKTEVSISKDTNVTTEDKSDVVIEEKVDTTVYTKPIIKHTSTPGINNLSDINNLILLSDDLFEIRQTYDTLNKVLKTSLNAKPQKINVTIDKKTTISKDIKTKSNIKQDSIIKSSKFDKQVIVEKEPKNIFWYVILGIGTLATVYFISKKFL